jgi:hypothetical protein
MISECAITRQSQRRVMMSRYNLTSKFYGKRIEGRTSSEMNIAWSVLRRDPAEGAEGQCAEAAEHPGLMRPRRLSRGQAKLFLEPKCSSSIACIGLTRPGGAPLEQPVATRCILRSEKRLGRALYGAISRLRPAASSYPRDEARRPDGTRIPSRGSERVLASPPPRFG